MKTLKGLPILAFVLVLVFLLAACAAQEASPPPEAAPEGTATPLPTLPPLPSGKTVIGEGHLASPYPELALGFGGEVAGRVVTITVVPGDLVAAGDLLAVLDDSELQRAVDEAQQALDRAVADRERAQLRWENDLADAEKALADARRVLTTTQLTYSDTGVEEARAALDQMRRAEADAQQQYNNSVSWGIGVDEARDALEHATRQRQLAEMRLADAEDSHRADYLTILARRADVAQAERKLAALQQEGLDPAYDRAVEDARRQLEQAEEKLSHARLTAPWAALVLAVNATPGAEVGGGTPVVTLLNLADGLRFIADNMSEQHIGPVYPGQRAVVTLRSFPDRTLDGVVEAVVPQTGPADEEAVGGRFAVRVRLAPVTDLRLLPGMTGRVEIFVGEE